MFIDGIAMTLSSLSLALWPHKRARTVKRRILEGDDRFFEEQRSYQAYPWLHDTKRLRIAGIIGTICGLTICTIELFRP